MRGRTPVLTPPGSAGRVPPQYLLKFGHITYPNVFVHIFYYLGTKIGSLFTRLALNVVHWYSQHPTEILLHPFRNIRVTLLILECLLVTVVYRFLSLSTMVYRLQL